MQQKKGDKYFVPTRGTQLFNKIRKKSIKVTFKNNKLTRYITPTVPEKTPLKILHQFHNINQVITTWQNWNNWSTTEPPNYITFDRIPTPHYIINQKTMIAAEVAVKTQTMALLPPPQIFGKVPKYEWYGVTVLSTRCGGCHPKGLIVARSYKIKQTILIITITRISTNITFIGQFQFSF